MERHLSTLAIDSLELGALSDEEAAAARAHLEACGRCRAEAEAARAAQARFAREVFPRTLPSLRERAQRQRTPPWRALLVAFPVLAAAVALLLLWPRGMELRRYDGIGVKGGEAALHGFARRGEHVFPVGEGTQLAAGDDLRFVVEPAGHRFVLIASVDGAGSATVYYPYGGAASAELGGGPRVELPGSIRLDAAPGPERVFALFSDQPLDAGAVLDDLRALGAGGEDAIRQHRALDGAGAAAQATLLFEKAPR